MCGKEKNLKKSFVGFKNHCDAGTKKQKCLQSLNKSIKLIPKFQSYTPKCTIVKKSSPYLSDSNHSSSTRQVFFRDHS